MSNPVVEEFKAMVTKNNWQSLFEQAIAKCRDYGVESFNEVITNYDDYVTYMDVLLETPPYQESNTSRTVYDDLCKFYFPMSVEPVKDLQSPIVPSGETQDLTELSAWIIKYAKAWGNYMDTLESASKVDTFKDNYLYTWTEYMPPPTGYLTYNQFFARHVKPGMRPIASISDNSVIVSPADSSFIGWWSIDQDNSMYAQQLLHIKGVEWTISQLLEGSAYKDAFKGGIFTHSFLSTYNYHRWHTPVQGKVLEAKIIQGQCYLNVNVLPGIDGGKVIKVLNATDGTGYQFVQTRGLAIIDSPMGLVACLPIGMAQVSSVVITAEVGVELHKGEELGYFQFGGSDFVMVFQRGSNVQLFGRPGQQYLQGMAVGKAHGYSK